MPVDVILPKVDMDMTTGVIEAWKVREGQAVREGDVLFEISTNKAVMEIDAPEDGIIRQITDAKNTALPVGTVVARIYKADEALIALPPLARAAGEIEVKKGAIVA
ncbi:MAG: lipoyl domain-containing protein, partial [Beijerinckiaceae bacterium]